MGYGGQLGNSTRRGRVRWPLLATLAGTALIAGSAHAAPLDGVSGFEPRNGQIPAPGALRVGLLPETNVAPPGRAATERSVGPDQARLPGASLHRQVRHDGTFDVAADLPPQLTRRLAAAGEAEMLFVGALGGEARQARVDHGTIILSSSQNMIGGNQAAVPAKSGASANNDSVAPPARAECTDTTCPAVPPPPPGPGGCRGPDCPSAADLPRDEIVMTLPSSSGHVGPDNASNLNIPLIDMSSLDVQSESVDSGVTSGGDQGSWDSVDVVASANRYENCEAGDKAQPSDRSPTEACEAQRQQGEQKPH